MKRYAKDLIKDLKLEEAECCPKCIFNYIQIYLEDTYTCKINNNYLYPEYVCKYDSYHKSCKVEQRNQDLLEKCFTVGGI